LSLAPVAVAKKPAVQRLGRIEIDVGKQRRVISEVRADQQQRVAVRRSGRDALAPIVVPPPERFSTMTFWPLQVLCEHAGQGVHRSARHKGHHHFEASSLERSRRFAVTQC
jgi:hypothetical protein